jgi:hypothetical protein
MKGACVGVVGRLVPCADWLSVLKAKREDCKERQDSDHESRQLIQSHGLGCQQVLSLVGLGVSSLYLRVLKWCYQYQSLRKST